MYISLTHILIHQDKRMSRLTYGGGTISKFCELFKIKVKNINLEENNNKNYDQDI